MGEGQEAIHEEGNETVNSYHVATAAEAIAAAQFARLGCNIAVQYGANQPEYDLIVDDKPHPPLRVSVKGSQKKGWLIAPKKKDSTYHARLTLG
jgi:hypothetical protein